ncbi:OLC1v1022547C1 [Oldenlandia corymbosa var. corymbosa]|uniref:OLC1v1022547C1 n=1 Tax=Oldenlandia corymbosa var. corymbosa TaxID=529605 RepID=A0AAV1BY42_OLDCO|nr:OLC1v1022547C1 [Oldenlandia corymbosa var. corymbosa]
MAGFGYFKDFPEILHRLLEGPDVTLQDENSKRDIPTSSRSARIQANLRAQAIKKQDARIQRHAKQIEKAKKAVERYGSDPDYKFLHQRLPEVYIGANDWANIPYHRVASVAMKFYKEKFLFHDKERFQEYLNHVKVGKAKIAAGALLPHELIASMNMYGGASQVAELQWQRTVEDDLAKNGKLKNCLTISDVSASMIGLPMEVSMALGVLVSELSDEPCKGNLITFSENPTFREFEETVRKPRQIS